MKSGLIPRKKTPLRHQVPAAAVDTEDMRMSAPFIAASPPTVIRAAMLIGGLLSVVPVQAGPLQFASTLEQSRWEAQTSRARCLLLHPISDYGKAEFSREAGGVLRLRVDTPKPPVQAYQAALRSVPPAWNHRAAATVIGTRLLDPGDTALVIEGGDAQTLLDGLERGLNIELGFGPVGAAEHAVVTLSAVRVQLALPDFQDCLAMLKTVVPARNRPKIGAGHAQATARSGDAPRAAARPPPRSTPQPAAVEDPYVRTDVVTVDAASAAADAGAGSGAETRPKPVANIPGTAGAVLGLIDELSLRYSPDQNELSNSARAELGGFAREYLAQRRRDVVLIAGSATDGPLTRRRALEIKGYLVRTGLPPTHVLIHVPGEKLPERDGQAVKVPDDATRMVVWRVR